MPALQQRARAWVSESLQRLGISKMAMHIVGSAGLQALPYAVKRGAVLQPSSILCDMAEIGGPGGCARRWRIWPPTALRRRRSVAGP